MTDEQPGYLRALADLRSWHRWQLRQKSDHHSGARESHEEAIAYLDLLIATKRRHAAEHEASRQRSRAANFQIGCPARQRRRMWSMTGLANQQLDERLTALRAA